MSSATNVFANPVWLSVAMLRSMLLLCVFLTLIEVCAACHVVTVVSPVVQCRRPCAIVCVHVCGGNGSHRHHGSGGEASTGDLTRGGGRRQGELVCTTTHKVQRHTTHSHSATQHTHAGRWGWAHPCFPRRRVRPSPRTSQRSVRMSPVPVKVHRWPWRTGCQRCWGSQG